MSMPTAQQKLDIDLPIGAVPGDKLTFTVGAANGSQTTFSAVVPMPANLNMPMKKISVTVSVPFRNRPRPWSNCVRLRKA